VSDEPFVACVYRDEHALQSSIINDHRRRYDSGRTSPASNAQRTRSQAAAEQGMDVLGVSGRGSTHIDDH